MLPQFLVSYPQFSSYRILPCSQSLISFVFPLASISGSNTFTCSSPFINGTTWNSLRNSRPDFTTKLVLRQESNYFAEFQNFIFYRIQSLILFYFLSFHTFFVFLRSHSWLCVFLFCVERLSWLFCGLCILYRCLLIHKCQCWVHFLFSDTALWL